MSLPNSLQLRAFNLLRGAAILNTDDGSVWVVMEDPARYPEVEMIRVLARRADIPRESPRDTVEAKYMHFDYCDEVILVGLVVNESDLDDNDWGTD